MPLTKHQFLKLQLGGGGGKKLKKKQVKPLADEREKKKKQGAIRINWSANWLLVEQKSLTI